MSSRKSSRIASRGPQRRQEGPTRVDLTEDSPPRAEERTEESQHSAERVIDAEPVSTLKSHAAYDLYRRLKDGGVSLKTIGDYLKERGYKNEFLFLTEMERLNVVEKGTARRTMETMPSDPLENAPTETIDDDERLFLNFEPRLGVAAKLAGVSGSLFRSKEQERVYTKLLKRGVVNPRSVDFDFLELIKINLREKFARLQLEEFCADQTEGHSELAAYFYSNLSFLDANHLSFSVMDKDYIVGVELLADIIGVERRGFQPIKVSTAFATLDIVRDRSVEGKISYSRMNASNVLLHKVIINCIRPKSTSKTDVSKTEAKLMFAINQGKPFSLPHVILFHMFRTVVKDKGQLPYSSLITKLFRHFEIPIPKSLCLSNLNPLIIGEKMVMRMKIPDLTRALERLKKQTPAKSTPAASKRKGKEQMAEKKKRKIVLQDEDEEEEEAMTLSTLSRVRRPAILRTEDAERERRRAEELEAERLRETEEARKKEEEQRREEERREEQRREEERREEERREEQRRAEERREEERREEERAEEEERRRKDEEESRMQEDLAALSEQSLAEEEETEKHPSTDMDAGDEFITPPTGMKTGGVAAEHDTLSPLHFSGVSRSGADPEEVYASHFPEHEESTPAGKETGERERPSFQTFSAGPSGSFVNSTAFTQLMDTLLDLKKQVYVIDTEMRDLKQALLIISGDMQAQINALRTQAESNQTGAELATIKEMLANLGKSVQELEKFQLVRFPPQP